MATLEKKEQNRLVRCLKKSNVDPVRLDVVKPVIEHVSWMYVKLCEAKDQMADEPIMVEYDNGGGQTGIRENPIFKAYESLWKSYLSGVKVITETLPDTNPNDLVDKDMKPDNVLSLVKAKRKAEV